MSLGRKLLPVWAALLVVAAGGATAAWAQTTLKVVMHSDLKIIDPIWTTAYIVRNHGYMIYDTLFAMDAKGEIKPQMVDRYEVSRDQLTYTLTLRDGLQWHDGKPVTAEDCVASIKRWAAKDSMGQKMMSFVKDMQVVNPKTFTILLKEPTGLVLGALGKPSSNVPFMMPKRVADTDANTQISDSIGSGPFIFKKDEWKPGDKAVYVKNPNYKPRGDAPSGLAGAKVVKVDRVEWRSIPDHQTAINALLAGEIDFVESPPHDLYPVLKQDANVRLVVANPLGNQYTFRFNTLHKPFDNPKVRQAVFYAFNQEDFLKGVIGDPQYYKPCLSFYPVRLAALHHEGHGGAAPVELQEVTGAPEGGRLRRHPDRAHALDRPRGARTTWPRSPSRCWRRAASRWTCSRWTGRRSSPAARRRIRRRPGLARLPHLVGVGRHPEPGHDGVPERLLREGDVRLAVRQGHRGPARRVRPRDEPGQAEADRRAGAGTRDAVSDPPPARAVVRRVGRAQEPERYGRGSGHRLLGASRRSETRDAAGPRAARARAALTPRRR